MRIANRITSWIWPWVWRVRRLVAKKGLEIGDLLPNFSLRELNGEVHRLSDYFHKKAVMLWLTNLCPSCEEKLPFLESLRKQYADALEILAISVLGRDFETPRRILQKHKFDFPLLVDPEDWVGRVLGFVHPEDACPLFNLLILDRSGKVTFRGHLSAVKEEKIEEVIQSIVRE